MYNTFFNLQAKAFENIQLQQMKIKILQMYSVPGND